MYSNIIQRPNSAYIKNQQDPITYNKNQNTLNQYNQRAYSPQPPAYRSVMSQYQSPKLQTSLLDQRQSQKETFKFKEDQGNLYASLGQGKNLGSYGTMKQGQNYNFNQKNTYDYTPPRTSSQYQSNQIQKTDYTQQRTNPEIQERNLTAEGYQLFQSKPLYSQQLYQNTQQSSDLQQTRQKLDQWRLEQQQRQMRSSSQQPFNKEKYKLSHPQSPAQNQMQQNLHEQYPSLYETPTFKPIDKDNQTLRQITELREQIKKLEDQNFELQKQLVQQEKINSENQYNKEIIIREINSILNNFDQDFTTRIASQKSLSKDPWEAQQSQNKLIMEMIFQLKANRRLHNVNQTEIQDKPKISNYEQKQEQFPTTAQYLQQTNSTKLSSLQGQNTYLQDQVQALEGRIRGMANPRPQNEEAKDMFIATFGQELQQQQQDYESQKYSYYGSRYLNQQKEELRENPYDHKYYK